MKGDDVCNCANRRDAHCDETRLTAAEIAYEGLALA